MIFNIQSHLLPSNPRQLDRRLSYVYQITLSLKGPESSDVFSDRWELTSFTDIKVKWLRKKKVLKTLHAHYMTKSLRTLLPKYFCVLVVGIPGFSSAPLILWNLNDALAHNGIYICVCIYNTYLQPCKVRRCGSLTKNKIVPSFFSCKFMIL